MQHIIKDPLARERGREIEIERASNHRDTFTSTQIELYDGLCGLCVCVYALVCVCVCCECMWALEVSVCRQGWRKLRR